MSDHDDRDNSGDGDATATDSTLTDTSGRWNWLDTWRRPHQEAVAEFTHGDLVDKLRSELTAGPHATRDDAGGRDRREEP